MAEPSAPLVRNVSYNPSFDYPGHPTQLSQHQFEAVAVFERHEVARDHEFPIDFDEDVNFHA